MANICNNLIKFKCGIKELLDKNVIVEINKQNNQYQFNLSKLYPDYFAKSGKDFIFNTQSDKKIEELLGCSGLDDLTYLKNDSNEKLTYFMVDTPYVPPYKLLDKIHKEYKITIVNYFDCLLSAYDGFSIYTNGNYTQKINEKKIEEDL